MASGDRYPAPGFYYKNNNICSAPCAVCHKRVPRTCIECRPLQISVDHTKMVMTLHIGMTVSEVGAILSTVIDNDP
jgi:hypothetical protein